MTKDEIIETAVQAGMYREVLTLGRNVELLTAFANLVAQHEREEIAQFIERTNLGSLPDETALHYAQLLKSYSTSIRARGQA
jgi:hypothetical protein